MTKYALIRWKDGYQEVAALDRESTGILRYYVVESVGLLGRLVFDSTRQYPELKIIGRKPREIETITVIGDGKGEVFALSHKEDKAKGELVDHHYKFEENDQKVVEELVSKLKGVSHELGIYPETAKEEDLERVRKAMRLSAFEKESEVLDFIKLLLGNLSHRRK